MSKALQGAEELLKRFGISAAPVPVYEIARALGVDLVFEPYRGDKISGMLHRKGGHAVIGVNSLEPEARKRFSVAHELGHLVLHKGKFFLDGRLNFRNARSALGVDKQEIEANLFASHLLMPESLINTYVELLLSREPYLDEDSLINKLAKQFDVSTTAMRYRLTSLGHVRVS